MDYRGCILKDPFFTSGLRLHLIVKGDGRFVYCYMLDVLWHCQEVPGLNVLCLSQGQQRSWKGRVHFAPFHQAGYLSGRLYCGISPLYPSPLHYFSLPLALSTLSFLSPLFSLSLSFSIRPGKRHKFSNCLQSALVALGNCILLCASFLFLRSQKLTLCPTIKGRHRGLEDI